MNLYIISQDHNNDWDTYDAVIVAAESEDEAREINPRGYGCKDDYDSTWAEKQYVKVKLIGVAEVGITKGVILASFNAG